MKAHRTSVPVFKHAELAEPGSEILDVTMAPALRARLQYVLVSLTGKLSRLLRRENSRQFFYRDEKEAWSLDHVRMKANRDFIR